MAGFTEEELLMMNTLQSLCNLYDSFDSVIETLDETKDGTFIAELDVSQEEIYRKIKSYEDRLNKKIFCPQLKIFN